MATETTSNKITLVSRFNVLVAGLQALADADSLVLAGKTYMKSAVVDVLSAYVKANGTAAAGKLQWRKAVADEKSALAAARPVRALLKTFLQSRLGKASPQLNGFGFETTKAPRASAKTKAAAVDKNKATRAARHTMGTTQRKRVKAPTPPSPEPVPTASTQPAQPAPAGVKPA